jgi:DNA-binding Lrp family transcriptional regulator
MIPYVYTDRKSFAMENKVELVLDAIDKQIIDLLRADGKMNYKEIASIIGLSVTPTYERIKRMERQGVITGYTALVDRRSLGKALQIFCQVSLTNHHVDSVTAFETGVTKLNEITASYHITGTMDYLLHIEIEDIDHYHQFLRNKLTLIPHIGQINSNFVMRELK